MTVAETRNAFGYYIDEYGTARAQNPDFWINEGIEAFVKMRLKPTEQGLDETGFEITQRIKDDLQNLVVVGATTTYASGVVAKPTTCYELIPHSILLGLVSTNQIYARSRTWGWYQANKKNSFKKPIFKDGRLIYIESSTGYNIFPVLAYQQISVSFIRKWLPFAEAQVIELHEKTHKEITRLAAAKYLASVNNYDGAKNLLSQNLVE